MNRAIEIHDSTFAGTSNSDGLLIIILDKAYIHESNGVPGQDNGKGFSQAINLELLNPVIDSMPSSLPSELSDGYVSVNGHKISNCIPLPVSEVGEIEISFITSKNEQLTVKCSELKSTTLGEAKYIEEFKA